MAIERLDALSRRCFCSGYVLIEAAIAGSEVVVAGWRGVVDRSMEERLFKPPSPEAR